ncbi:hypothetical protein BH18ACT9_BH18ACT9_18590 [soil metagenome]
MPTYQYSCTECDHAFEEFQSFSDDSLTVCPRCSARLRKVFNAVGVVFKGSGFYRNDSRVEVKSSSSNGSESTSDSSSDSGSDSGSGSTPDSGSGSGSGSTSDKTGAGNRRPTKSGKSATTTSDSPAA